MPSNAKNAPISLHDIPKATNSVPVQKSKENFAKHLDKFTCQRYTDDVPSKLCKKGGFNK